MVMTVDQQIALHQLLLEREALFLRVHLLERRIEELLGVPYPFPPPPALPSRRPLPKIPRRQFKPPTSPTLRELEEGEVAYRVTFRNGGQEWTEKHVQRKPLEALLRLPESPLCPIKIVVEYDFGGEGDVLWQKEGG